jgi:CRISPR-associated protein Cas1
MKRSVAILSPAALKKERRQLVIAKENETHTVPIEDLAILVLDHEAIQVTGPLLGELGEQGVAVIVCNGKHLPSAYLLPYPGNELMAQTMRAQIEAKLPAKKRIWQTIIQEKIRAQGRLLIEMTGDDAGLGMMAHQVRSGDTTNREALAATIAFERLFGRGFHRARQDEDPDQADIDRVLNAMLNYGYAVLRAAVARAIVLAGLHPALGVHHRHRNNAYCLADDLMEPLRPLVDRETCVRMRQGDLPPDLTPELKRHMLGVLTAEVRWDGRLFPLDAALEWYAAGVRRCLAGEQKVLQVPSA